jgi:membrane protease YdiL (CAAX protease family)
VTHRSGAVAGWTGGPAGILAAFLALGVVDAAVNPSDQNVDGGIVAILAVVAVALAVVCIRAFTGGVVVRADAIVVRRLSWSRRIPIASVAGFAIEPVVRRRAAALAVVTTSGDVVTTPFAIWRMRTTTLQNAVVRATQDAGRVLPYSVDIAGLLADVGRLEHAAAFTVQLPDGRMTAVPAATPDPGLTPQTVTPVADESRRLLGWETVFVSVAFVLPAAAAAAVILIRHVERVSDLDEFALPLKHNPAGSLPLMVLLYASTAVVTPIALLLLARGGLPPRALGLAPRWFRLDLLPSVGLLGGVWVANIAVALALSPLLNDKSLSNTSANTHVPAYFVIYALFVSAVTAMNEEVVVNGYLMTRLAQRGWQPWPSLALSLALRTSYHAYYGVAIIATVPFGYLVTRSFQRTGRVSRPILTHFLFDAILLTIAVLTS